MLWKEGFDSVNLAVSSFSSGTESFLWVTLFVRRPACFLTKRNKKKPKEKSVFLKMSLASKWDLSGINSIREVDVWEERLTITLRAKRLGGLRFPKKLIRVWLKPVVCSYFYLRRRSLKKSLCLTHQTGHNECKSLQETGNKWQGHAHRQWCHNYCTQNRIAQFSSFYVHFFILWERERERMLISKPVFWASKAYASSVLDVFGCTSFTRRYFLNAKKTLAHADVTFDIIISFS